MFVIKINIRRMQHIVGQALTNSISVNICSSMSVALFHAMHSLSCQVPQQIAPCTLPYTMHRQSILHVDVHVYTCSNGIRFADMYLSSL